jgi:hypothetical protein
MKVTFAIALAMRLISAVQIKSPAVAYSPFEAVTVQCSTAGQGNIKKNNYQNLK